jgi:hypothetical protein
MDRKTPTHTANQVQIEVKPNNGNTFILIIDTQGVRTATLWIGRGWDWQVMWGPNDEIPTNERMTDEHRALIRRMLSAAQLLF